MSGCLIAALVVGGLALLCVIGFVIFVVVLAKKAVGIAQEGLNAPGSAEVRAAGCDMGIVSDLTKMTGSGGSGPHVMVLCQVQGNKAAPSCTEISAVYRKAVTPPGGYMVQVQQTGQSQPICQEIYSQQGTLTQKLK
jgi:hypothetical protein